MRDRIVRVRTAVATLTLALACLAGRAEAFNYVYTGHNGSNIQQDVVVDINAFMPWHSAGSAKALGMGGAFTAIADDAGAVEYNPAGLAQISRLEATVTGIAARSAEINADGNKTNQWSGTPTFGAAAFKLGRVTLGASIRKPYFPVTFKKFDAARRDVTAPDGWPMTYDTFSDKIDATGLKTYSVTGALSLGPVAVGANCNYMKGDVVRTVRGRVSSRSPSTTNSQFNSMDTANFSGFTVDVGALVSYKVLRLGASVRNLVGSVDVKEKYYWKDNFDLGGGFFIYDPPTVAKSYTSLAPTYTLGGALVLSKFFAADFDYSQTSLSGQDKAVGRLGGELWVIPGFLAARAGLRSDFKNVTNLGDEKTQEYYLGAGLHVWALEIDAAAALAQVKSGQEGSNFTGGASATLRF